MNVQTARQTLDDLMRTEGKAELTGGRVVKFMECGHKPARAAFKICRSLDDHSETLGYGYAYADGIGYAVPELSSGRESFSPDASFFTGALPINEMRFNEGAPVFAAEVRSENDYGPSAEWEQAEKRQDYFEAGTRVVWDVDPIAMKIYKYTFSSPDVPTVYRQGDTPDAELAVPGWRVAVDDIFR